MKRTMTFTALTLSSMLSLAACGNVTGSDSEFSATTAAESIAGAADHTAESGADEHHAHEHNADGGQPPAGIEEAENPTYPIGTKVSLTADHMPGMKGATATITGAFDTTTYSVSYTPTVGGEPVNDHRWVVHEELVDPGEAPLPESTKVVLDAEHMPGMKGAEATIDYSTNETVYMVNIDTEEMTMTNHKWVTEDELLPEK